VPGTNEFGFYYTLSKTVTQALPSTSLLAPFLETRLPDGVGMSFDETMEGWYFEGAATSAPGRDGDLKIGGLVPPAGEADCSFQASLTVRDVNEFVDGLAHEASMKGSIRFAHFQGRQNVKYALNERSSLFNYLTVNPASGGPR
jgi:hypothetical protein